jgi:hypothetical protein
VPIYGPISKCDSLKIEKKIIIIYSTEKNTELDVSTKFYVENKTIV